MKPFDRVIVRDYSNNVWKAGFYSHYEKENDFPFECVGSYYNQCIPYNDETKHLIGTTNDCSNYYKTW